MLTVQLHGINDAMDAMSTNIMIAGAKLNIVHTNPAVRDCYSGAGDLENKRLQADIRRHTGSRRFLSAMRRGLQISFVHLALLAC